MENLTVHVLFRFNTKTGKIDTTMTSIGHAMMELWALQNTTASKTTLIVERDTGKVVFLVTGRKEKWPTIQKENLGNIDEYGITLEDLKQIKDKRFDAGE